MSILKFVKNELLTSKVDAGIGSTFCKGPRCFFSEGLAPDSAL